MTPDLTRQRYHELSALLCEYLRKPGGPECGQPATHRLKHKTWAYDVNYLLCEEHARPKHHPPTLRWHIGRMEDK